ncbi:MAG: substrate-binding domain-containing protein [Sedimentisphaerales bacterium]|nr:substrate-binding domain-containing protein [Sedimentisphaerales bacterium]
MYKNRSHIVRTILCITFGLCILSVTSCEQEKNNSSVNTEVANPTQTEILIYCGITMIRPITEIAAEIEKQEKCKVTIIKGGSGDLLKTILENKKGDLYLPGTENYFDQIEGKYPDLITRRERIGMNKAAIMVQKGNPLNFSNDLTQLANRKYAVVIGNDLSGSIGKETRTILEKKGIYKDVVRNAMSLTTDSKDLVKALRNKQADIVINWYAVYTWDDNKEYMDVIEIDSEYCQTQDLAIGLLNCSANPDIANKIIDMAISEHGQNILRKYGLLFP